MICLMCINIFFFFFSSRRRHTRWTGDWSSDVCSSDLDDNQGAARAVGLAGWRGLYPCRDGGDRRLLEAGVACLKRRRFHAGVGERGACQERARGRKTDVNDATWLADLLAHGLIRSRF